VQVEVAVAMKRWSGFFLALVVALVFALLGVYYLLPHVYHPLSGDTYLQYAPHVKHAVFFLALAVFALILGGFLRPTAKA
jgi:CDP-diglyceride synthetase